MLQVENLRPSSSSTIFVSYVRPHKSVSSKTLSRWMTAILTLGGVDTSVFQQHSARAAAAALHRSRGLTVRQLCVLADWSLCSNTFRKFYERYI